MSVSSQDGVCNLPWFAEAQPNNLNRSMVRLGISYQELAQRPNYWTIQKQMEEHNQTKARCQFLEEEVKRLQ